MKYYFVHINGYVEAIVKASSMRVAVNRAIERFEGQVKSTNFTDLQVVARMATSYEVAHYRKTVEEPVAAHNTAMRAGRHAAATCQYCTPGGAS